MRLIDADALKIAIVEEGQRSKRYKIGEFWELNRDEIWKVINCMPTIEPERKTGKWREHIFDGIMGGRPRALMCTWCNYISLCAYNYCPNCGAKMEEGTA